MAILSSHVIAAGVRAGKFAPEKIGYDVRDFGGKCDGTTDDTDAVANAVAAAKAGTVSVIYSDGNCKFDPTQITWGDDVTFAFSGKLTLMDTWTVPSATHIIGIPTPSAKVQFTKGTGAQIIPPAAKPALVLNDGKLKTLENFEIYLCDYGIFIEGTSSLIAANVVMRNVSVIASCANISDGSGYALKIDNAFWIWAYNCVFTAMNVAGADKSIIINKTIQYGRYTGLINFNDCVTQYRGIRLQDDVGSLWGIYINHHLHEQLPAGEDFLDLGRAREVYLHDLRLDDGEVGTGWDVTGSGAQGVTITGSQDLNIKPGAIETGHYIADDYATNVMSDTPGVSYNRAGAFQGRLMGRQHTPIKALGTPVAFSIPAGSYDDGDITITSGATAPDLSTDAVLVTAAELAAGNYVAQDAVATFSLTVNDGDSIFFGGLLRNSDATLPSSNIMRSDPLSGTGSWLTYEKLGAVGLDHRLEENGWIPFFGYWYIQDGATDHTFQFDIKIQCQSARSFTIAWPWMRHFKASDGETIYDAIRFANMAGDVPADLARHVVGSRHPIRTGLSVTAGRPSASAVGAGAQWFDTTLNQPIWSTGSGWVAADGTAA